MFSLLGSEPSVFIWVRINNHGEIIMSWIVNSVGRALEGFSRDRLLLTALGLLDKELETRGGEFPGVGSAFQLLDIVADRRDAQDVIKQ
jgi:hypothetical protein